MRKVFIDPGHGGVDPGAVSNGLQEKKITLKIAKQIETIILDNYSNVSVKCSRTGDETVSLLERVNLANRWGADLFLSIHVNAGGGTGFESYVYPKVSDQTKQYQVTIHDEIMKEVKWHNRGWKKANFYVLRMTGMPAVLTENGFIDHPSDVEQLKKSSFLMKIAKGHVKGIAKVLQLQPKGYIHREPSLFKIQIGAFENLNSAENLAEKAKKAGFDVYIVKE